jgi:general secretion pathway protein K
VKLPVSCSCPVEITLPAVRQTGVALITVLLIVFLASIAAISLASMQQIAIRRSGALLHQQQARLYTLGIEQEGLLILIRDRQNNKTDHPGEAWASLPLVLPVDGGTLAGRIRDLQGCFNLNNLWQPDQSEAGGPAPNKKADDPTSDGTEAETTDPDMKAKANRSTKSKAPPAASGNPKVGKASPNEAQIKVLQRLLTGLELKPDLAQAVVDWIDPDSDPQFPDGAEDSDYLTMTPSYLAANRPLVSVSELRLIKGVDRETYNKLAPLVCALPPGTPLNVNTAPVAVLAALSEAGDAAELQRLREESQKEDEVVKPYETVDQFLNAAKLTVDAPTKALLSVDSQYFLLRAEARVGDGRAMLYSSFYRDENGVRVLRRSFGNQD